MGVVFDKAFDEVLGIEGGYVNDPVDRGGETKFGITERLARAHGYTGSMRDLSLKNAKAIYKVEFWDTLRLDDVAKINEKIALELFDSSVNIGTTPVARWFQIGMNLLNRSQALWANLLVDGQIGPMSIDTLKKLEGTDLVILHKILNILQGAHYLSLAERSESQERFIRGWLTRVQLS